jgi:hypothetical protein
MAFLPNALIFIGLELALGLIVQSVSIAVLLFAIGVFFISVTLLVGFLGPLRRLTAD